MFKVEKEVFCSIAGLDEQWQSLAKTLISEDFEKNNELLEQFKKEISSNVELKELSKSELAEDDSFLIRHKRI